jgi:hypothetical protein
MRKQSLADSITVVVTSVLALAGIALARDPKVGTRRMDAAKSRPGYRPDKSLTIDAGGGKDESDQVFTYRLFLEKQ